MKKKKKKHALLNKVKKHHKENNMHDIPDSSIVRRPPSTSGQKVGRTRGPDWSDAELEYINSTCEAHGNVTHELLGEIASILNKHIHENKEVRSASGIWWMLKRFQEKGKFDKFKIPGGSPKPKAPKKESKPKVEKKNIIPPIVSKIPTPKMDVRGAVNKAMSDHKPKNNKTPLIPPMPNVRAEKQNRKDWPPVFNEIINTNKSKFCAVVENSNGKIVKIETKFNNFEEFIFAVT